MSKFLPDDPREFAKFLRERTAGHAPGYDIAIYARPHQWQALGKRIEDADSMSTPAAQLPPKCQRCEANAEHARLANKNHDL